ncbi:MAG TPA: hypothetical protein VF628_02130 [Allosphingosinicella sp.]
MAKSASAGARWRVPKVIGAVSRIGPATWVTASATTSRAASSSARMFAARA